MVSASARNRPAANSIERRVRLIVRNQPVSVPFVTSVARRSISMRVGNVSELIHSSESMPPIMMIPSVPEEPSAPEPPYDRAKSPIAAARMVGRVDAPLRLSGVMMSGSVTSR